MPKYEYAVTMTIVSNRPIVYAGHDTPTAVALWLDDRLVQDAAHRRIGIHDIRISRRKDGEPDPMWEGRKRTV